MKHLVLCTNNSRRLPPPNMLVTRPPAAIRLFEKSLGRGLSPVKKPEHLPERPRGLRFVCPSPSCNAPSLFSQTSKRGESPGVWDSRRALFLIDSGHEIAR